MFGFISLSIYRMEMKTFLIFCRVRDLSNSGLAIHVKNPPPLLHLLLLSLSSGVNRGMRGHFFSLNEQRMSDHLVWGWL